MNSARALQQEIADVLNADEYLKLHGVTAVPEDFAERLAAMEKRLADIDSYFTPLYAFLGLVYDPANEAVLAAYPTLDKRISALDEKLVQLQRDLAALRESLEPRTKEPRPVR